jgi:hypothetical protein
MVRFILRVSNHAYAGQSPNRGGRNRRFARMMDFLALASTGAALNEKY